MSTPVFSLSETSGNTLEHIIFDVFLDVFPKYPHNYAVFSHIEHIEHINILILSFFKINKIYCKRGEREKIV